MSVTAGSDVLGTFHGSEAFPIEWKDGEKELFWIFDDLHCPNPVSPLFFDIGGWWLTCDHMFRRFATPFACDWIAKERQRLRLHRGHPVRPGPAQRGHRVPGRYVPARPARLRRRPRPSARTSAPSSPSTPGTSSAGGASACARRSSATSPTSTAATTTASSLVQLAVLFEDAIDVHDRHWKIHWMLNFAQFASTLALNAAIADARGEADPALLGRLQSSRRGPQLGLDRGPVEHEGGGQGRRRPHRGLRRADRAGRPARPGRLERGRRFLEERLAKHRQDYGYKAIWSHEFAFKTWLEDPAPILEAVRGYLATDYDYPAHAPGRPDDLEAAATR